MNSIERKTAVRFRGFMNAALHFLAITSIFVTFPYAHRVAGNVMSETLAGPVAGVVALLIYFFIDAPLSNALEYLIRTSARGAGLTLRFWSMKSHQVRRMIAFTIALFTMVLTGGMSFISSTLIADTASPAPDERELATRRDQDRSTHTAILDEMKAAESKAERDVNRAKRDGSKLVAGAITAGPDRWRELYRSRNGWFLNQGGAIRKYRQAITQAQSDSAALVDQARAVYADATRAKTAHLAAADTVTLVTDRAFSVRADRAALLFSTLWRFVFAMDLAAVAVVIVLAIFLGSYFRDGGDLPTAKSSFGEALSEWQNRKWDQFTEWLFRRNDPTERPTKSTEKDPTERGPSPDVIPANYPTERGHDNGRELAVLQARQDVIDMKLDRIITLIPTERNPTELRPKDETPSENKPTQTRRKTRRKVERAASDGMKPCRNCGERFVGKTKRAAYCSDACRKSWHEKKRKS